MKWFPPAGRSYDIATSMIGVKSGDRLLIAGCLDGRLAGELARMTGLNGRAVLVDPDPLARACADRAARDAGALLEYVQAPFAHIPESAEAFDVVVLNEQLGALPADGRAAVCGESRRVLRGGGRLICVERAAPARKFSLRTRTQPAGLPGSELVHLADAAGFKAVRILLDPSQPDGARLHAVFVEGTRPRVVP